MQGVGPWQIPIVVAKQYPKVFYKNWQSQARGVENGKPQRRLQIQYAGETLVDIPLVSTNSWTARWLESMDPD